MISVKNKEPQIYYGSKTIKEVYKGSTKIYPSVDTQKIMDSLVCWYDPGKQQCTNESMTANPVLADLSGNGHDIECFNFGWSGMSGIGGYVFQPLDRWYKAPLNNGTYTVEGYTLRITKLNTARYVYYVCNTGGKNYVESIEGKTVTTKSFRIRINGLPDGRKVAIGGILPLDAGSEHPNIPFSKQYFNSNGEHIVASVQATVASENDTWSGNVNYPDIVIESDTADDVDITIEILPEYPNALVSDGVDDYCYTDGFPILTKEKGYTVIAKRKLFYKENTLQSLASTGAFVLERQEANSSKFTYNFGSANKVTTYPEEITYQTSKSFNGTSLNVGDSAGTNSLKIFANTTDYTSIALYSFLLFDRDLTTAEIEWVKKNMVESRGGC